MNRKTFIIAFVLILFFAVFLRFYELDVRPYHHDESVHAHFSYKLFAEGYYQGYEPMWHGPFQFYASTLVFHIFGDSDWSGRFLPALFGAILVILPLFLRRYIGDAGTLFSSFLLAFSPSFLYHSRFFRNDIYIAFFSLGMLVCVFLHLETKKLLPLCLGALFLALSLTAKETAYLTLVIFVSFGAVYVLVQNIEYVGKNARKTILSALCSLKALINSLFALIKQNPKKIILALAVFFFVYYLFYSSFFASFFGAFNQNPEKGWRHLSDPLYAPYKAFSHWGSYSTGPTGPFFFYFPALTLLYELPIMVLGLVAVFYFIRKLSSKAFFASIIITPVWLYVFSKNIYSGISWNYDWWVIYSIHISAFFFFFALFFGIFCALYSLRFQHDRTQLLMLFLCYWFLAAVVIYSSVYEKAPWLLPYMLLPMVILAGKFFNDFKKMKPVAFVAIILSSLLVYTSINLNYVHYADPAEPMLQAAQPGESFRDIINKINEVASRNNGSNTKIQIAKVGEKEEFPRQKISGTQTTQYLWYLRKFKNLSWGAYPKELNAPLILSHWEYANEVEHNLTGYKRMNSTAMGWYWWRPEDFSLEYYFFRKMNRQPDGDRLVLFYKE